METLQLRLGQEPIEGCYGGGIKVIVLEGMLGSGVVGARFHT